MALADPTKAYDRSLYGVREQRAGTKGAAAAWPVSVA